MNLALILVASVLCLTFGGCTITGPQVKVKPPIEIQTEPAKDTGRHCPPGHAKKGWC